MATTLMFLIILMIDPLESEIDVNMVEDKQWMPDIRGVGPYKQLNPYGGMNPDPHRQYPNYNPQIPPPFFPGPNRRGPQWPVYPQKPGPPQRGKRKRQSQQYEWQERYFVEYQGQYQRPPQWVYQNQQEQMRRAREMYGYQAMPMLRSAEIIYRCCLPNEFLATVSWNKALGNQIQRAMISIAYSTNYGKAAINITKEGLGTQSVRRYLIDIETQSLYMNGICLPIANVSINCTILDDWSVRLSDLDQYCHPIDIPINQEIASTQRYHILNFISTKPSQALFKMDDSCYQTPIEQYKEEIENEVELINHLISS